jgi:hypothetical protein
MALRGLRCSYNMTGVNRTVRSALRTSVISGVGIRLSGAVVSRALAGIGAGLLLALPRAIDAAQVAPTTDSIPPIPYVEDALCDYCFDPVLVCTAVDARVEDHRDGAIAFTSLPGDSLEVLGGRIHVESPGLLVVHDTLDFSLLSGYINPPEVDSIRALPGDTLYVLTIGYEGGDGTWWYRGRIYRSENIWMFPLNLHSIRGGSGRPLVESVRPVRSTWWMRVRNALGELGWIVEDGRSVVWANHYEPAMPPCPAMSTSLSRSSGHNEALYLSRRFAARR